MVSGDGESQRTTHVAQRPLSVDGASRRVIPRSARVTLDVRLEPVFLADERLKRRRILPEIMPPAGEARRRSGPEALAKATGKRPDCIQVVPQ